MITCEYDLPTNLQNFMQKDLTEVKIFQKVLGGYFFWNTVPVDLLPALVAFYRFQLQSSITHSSRPTITPPLPSPFRAYSIVS